MIYESTPKRTIPSTYLINRDRSQPTVLLRIVKLILALNITKYTFPGGWIYSNNYLKIPMSIAIINPARKTQKMVLTTSTGTSSLETSVKSSRAGSFVRYRGGVTAAKSSANNRITNKTGIQATL